MHAVAVFSFHCRCIESLRHLPIFPDENLPDLGVRLLRCGYCSRVESIDTFQWNQESTFKCHEKG